MGLKQVPSGCITALVTPFDEKGEVDFKGLKKNIEFQISQGIKGVVPTGTTGESPTLNPSDHLKVIDETIRIVQGRVFVLAGCGSNSTREARVYTAFVAELGADGVLLVDCYYNGPSSLELRKEYYEPIAKQFSNLAIVPYIIPQRTGCALHPADLALLALKYPNLSAVKEASGNMERVKEIRDLAPNNFKIFCGDDNDVYHMMSDIRIMASGVISVIANLAPKSIQTICESFHLYKGGDSEEIKKALKIFEALKPLFEVVTIQDGERNEKIEKISAKMEIVPERVAIYDKFRNPVPIKTMMQGLGMPSGLCRPPLGKMTKYGVDKVRNALRTVWEKYPEALKPIQDFYGVDIQERLNNNNIWDNLAYQD